MEGAARRALSARRPGRRSRRNSRGATRLEAGGIWLGIIDTAATNNALAMRAIARADLCLMPVRPSPADMEAAIPTLIAIRRLNRRFAFVLNQTPLRGCRLSEAATSLNSLGVLALPYVGQRNDHQDALGAGLGVTEFAQEGRASEEIRALCGWVSKQLNREVVVHG
jgi:chromosome partitioning protein